MYGQDNLHKDSVIAVKFNNKPRVGIMKDYSDKEGFIIASVKGVNWLLEEKQIRKLKEK